MALLKHTGFNLVGLGAPLLVAVFSIPPLIDALGVPRFGVLTLIWAVSSYFGLFDLGLGRALTLNLASAYAQGEKRRASELAATGLLLMGALGVIAGLAMALLSPWLVGGLQDVTTPDETLAAMHAMCWAMPAIVLTPGLRGILESKHAFGLVNLLRLPMGLFTFLGPLAVVMAGHPRLDVIAWVLALGRIGFVALHGILVWWILEERSSLRPRTREVSGLCRAGGWLSVGNLVAPLMGYADRFVIGLLVSSAAVAYYATPQELVTKLWIIPGALTTVLFPTFAARAGTDHAEERVLFHRALAAIYATVLPLTLALALFATEILHTWLGPEMAEHGSLPLRVFAVGMFVSCLATIPYTLLQGTGHARTTALIHLAQLPAFLGVLWWLTDLHGLAGAVTAWALRIGIDTALMFRFGLAVMKRQTRPAMQRRGWFLVAVAALGFAGMAWPSTSMRLGWLLCTCALLLPLVWPALGWKILASGGSGGR